MPFCLHCGRPVSNDDANCSGCGAPVTDGEQLADSEEIEQLIRDGQTIAAIKAYREATGAGLKEAKDAIDGWQTHGQWPNLADRGEMPEQAKRLAREGRKIEAIKAYREATGASLAEAKKAVESWMEADGIVAIRPGSGCAGSLLGLITLFGTGGFLVVWTIALIR